MDNDPVADAIRRSFFLSSLVLPVVLAIAGAVVPDGAAFLRMGGDIMCAVFFLALPSAMLLRSRRPELFVPMFHVGIMGFASVLCAHSVLLDDPRMFLFAFLWVIVGTFLSLRRHLDAFVPNLALVGHLIVMGTIVYGLLSWING